MVRALLDTNLLIDYLNGVPEAGAELNRHQRPAISIITWMEVLVGAPPDLAQATRGFIDRFDCIQIHGDIAEHAVAIRRSRRIKLPDAIIWATAEMRSLILVTRNSRDFPADEPWVRIPYVR